MEHPLSTLLLSADRAGQANQALFGALYRELRGLARRAAPRASPGASPCRLRIRPSSPTSDSLQEIASRVADGYFLFLKPLKPGEHTLHFRRINADQSERGVRYTLIIGGGDDDRSLTRARASIGCPAGSLGPAVWFSVAL